MGARFPYADPVLKALWQSLAINALPAAKPPAIGRLIEGQIIIAHVSFASQVVKGM